MRFLLWCILAVLCMMVGPIGWAFFWGCVLLAAAIGVLRVASGSIWGLLLLFFLSLPWLFAALDRWFGVAS